MRKLIFLTGFIFCAMVAAAQESVTGLVTNSENEPLIGAHIININNIDHSAVTDETGKFTLIKFQETDTLLIKYIGYQERLYIPKEMDALNIQLTREQRVLREVSVKAVPMGAEVFAMEKLKPLDIYLNPASKADPLVAVNTTASSTTKDENAAVSFRGATANQTAYFINGVPLKNPVKYTQLNNTGTLSIFNTDFLRDVTIFPGNPPLEYGQSTSGAIILEMADRFPKYQQHSLSLSLANLGYSFRNQLNNDFHVGVFTNFQFNELLQFTNPRGLEDINSFRSNDLGVLLVKHSAFGSFKFFQYGLMDSYNFAFNHPSYKGEFVQSSVRSISTLKWVYDLSDFTFSLIAGNSYNQNNFEFGNLNYDDENLSPYLAGHVIQEGTSHISKIGYSYWGRENHFDGQYPLYDFALSPENPSDELSYTASSNIHEVYGYHRHSFGNTALGGGVRVGMLKNAQNEISYQLQFSQQLNKKLKLKLAAGKYYQNRIAEETEADEFITSFQQSIDIEYDARKLAFTQSFYRNAFDHKNVLGSETSVNFRFSRKLQVNQNLSFLDNDNSFDWFSRSTLDWKFLPGWSFSAILQFFKGQRYQMITSSTYNEQLDVYRPIYENGSSHFRPYRNISISVSKLMQLGDRLSSVWFFSLNNALDFKNTRDLEYNFNYNYYSKNYLSRRGIYFGVVLNQIFEPK